ncbi:hypothetical protein H0178_04170 [Cytobacillus firmus]|nr:hypothetical protein [Cytobacillus firmus]
MPLATENVIAPANTMARAPLAGGFIFFPSRLLIDYIQRIRRRFFILWGFNNTFYYLLTPAKLTFHKFLRAVRAAAGNFKTDRLILYLY